MNTSIGGGFEAKQYWEILLWAGDEIELLRVKIVRLLLQTTRNSQREAVSQ